MVNHSTLNPRRSGRNDGGDQPGPAGPPAPTQEETIAALQERLTVLEEQQRRQPPPPQHPKISVAKPTMFTGDKTGQQVLRWLAQIKTYTRAQEYGNGQEYEAEGKLMIAVSYLDEASRGQYDAAVELNGKCNDETDGPD
jgi:hypothetical protein